MDGAAPEFREVCLRCRRPKSVCWCAAVTPVPSQTRVVFIQHPREAKVPISTCRMAHLSLPNSELHVGLSAVGNASLEALCREEGVAVLFPSESDYPFDVMLLEGAGQSKPTASQFRAAAGLPAGTKVDTEALSTLMKPFATLDMGSPDYDDGQKATAQRMLALRDVLQKDLTDIQVFRTGSRAIGVYIMGRNAYGDLVGVHTTSIET